MTCPEQMEFFAYLENEVSVGRASEIETHLQGCRKCHQRWNEIQAIIKRIPADPGEFSNPEFVDKVLLRTRTRTLQKKPFQKPRTTLRWLIPIAASIGFAGLVIAVAPWRTLKPPDPNNSFTARGASAPSNERWISFELFRPQAGTSIYQRVGDSIWADTPLVFSVTNAKQSPYTYLMIVGVQESGMFWYYPGFQDPHENPVSIELPTRSQPIHLRQEIRHQLAPGRLRIMAVFSKNPLDVLGVENLITRELAAKGNVENMGRLPIPNTGQLTALLQVEGRSKID